MDPGGNTDFIKIPVVRYSAKIGKTRNRKFKLKEQNGNMKRREIFYFYLKKNHLGNKAFNTNLVNKTRHNGNLLNE